jgi:hypothetical protein
MPIRTPFVALALSLVLAAACSPGEPDPSLIGGQTQKPPVNGTTTIEMPMECGDLGVAKLADFETKFIVPKCGQAKCHGPMSVFPPRNLDMPGMIRTNLVGKNASLNCKTDFYIKTGKGTEWQDSYILHKVAAEGDTLPCPTAGGKADAGGTRMPNKDDMPTIVGTKLNDGELKCFSWWVQSLGTVK